MISDSVQAFNDRVAASPELQAKLRAVTSPAEFLHVAEAEGLDLTGADLQTIAQQAYQQWIDRLPPKLARFFSQVHDTKTLNDQLKICQSSAEVIALAHRCDVQLTEDELRQAATLAEAIPSFSFEKIWFRNLGLI